MVRGLLRPQTPATKGSRTRDPRRASQMAQDVIVVLLLVVSLSTARGFNKTLDHVWGETMRPLRFANNIDISFTSKSKEPILAMILPLDDRT